MDFATPLVVLASVPLMFNVIVGRELAVNLSAVQAANTQEPPLPWAYGAILAARYLTRRAIPAIHLG